MKKNAIIQEDKGREAIVKLLECFGFMQIQVFLKENIEQLFCGNQRQRLHWLLQINISFSNKLKMTGKTHNLFLIYDLGLRFRQQSNMFKQSLLMLCVFSIAMSIEIDTLTASKLQVIKMSQDYRHHFVFFHKPTLNALQSHFSQWSGSDIRIFMNDCSDNNLPECKTPEETPLLLLFNRILIRYSGDPTNLEQIIEWGKRRIYSSPKYIKSMEELTEILNLNKNVFCFCQGQNNLQQSGLFYTLSKSLPFLNFCILNNVEVYTSLGLKDNNVTLFLGSTDNRRQYEHPVRFQAWEWFVKKNMLASYPRAQEQVGQRFAQKIKNVQFYAVACDYSLPCERVWQNLQSSSQDYDSKNLGYDFKIAIQDQQESFIFNLYYHLTFDLSKLPALIHIKLTSDSENAGVLERHVQYLEEFNLKSVDQFYAKTQKDEIKPFSFSAPLPKNNGFFGKGGEKFVQKLVAENVLSTIKESNNHYILLASALNIGCSQCQTFYKQYKQIASLLSEKDVTFGFLNVNENEVPIKQMTQLPQILLYLKDNKQQPIRMNVNHSFDHLMLFIKNNLGNEYADPNEL